MTTLPSSKLLVLLSVLIFSVAFGILTWGNPDAKFLWQALFLGLAVFATSFLIP